MPVTKRTEDIKIIRAIPGNVIAYSIIIGNAQIGSSTVKFKYDNSIIGKGEIKDLEIGKADDLYKKILRVATRVLDANAFTNKIIITHRFTNAMPSEFVYEDDIPEGKDVFTLLVDYKFEKQPD